MSINEIQSIELGSIQSDSVELRNLGLTDSDWSDQLARTKVVAQSEFLPGVEINQSTESILDQLDNSAVFKNSKPEKVFEDKAKVRSTEPLENTNREIPHYESPHKEPAAKEPAVKEDESETVDTEINKSTEEILNKAPAVLKPIEVDPDVDVSDSAFKLGQYLEANFKKIDTNGDHQLTKKELKNFRENRNEEGKKTINYVLGNYVALKELSMDGEEFAGIPTRERGLTLDDAKNLSRHFAPGIGFRNTVDGIIDVWDDHFWIPGAILALGARVHPKAMIAFGVYMAATLPLSGSAYFLQRLRVDQIMRNDRRYVSPFHNEDKQS